MTQAAQDVIHAFEALSRDEQHQVVTQILRHELADTPEVSDDEFLRAADQVFLRFDGDEALT